MNFIGKIKKEESRKKEEGRRKKKEKRKKKKEEEERRGNWNSDLFTWDVVAQNSKRYLWQLKTIQKQNLCIKSQEKNGKVIEPDSMYIHSWADRLHISKYALHKMYFIGQLALIT